MQSFRLLAAASILALSAIPSIGMAQEETGMTETQSGELTLERVFGSPSLNGSSPRGLKLSPDGRYLTLLRNRPDDKDRYDLWGFDRESGEWSMLVDSEKLGTGRELSEAEKMQRERQRIGSLKGIVTYDWAADGQAILVPLDGDLYLARLDGTTQRLTDTEESELNPALSETGAYVSFVRDGQLWTGKPGEDAAPVTPKEGDLISWGVAEFVAQEELDRSTGFWWSPDDRRIAVARVDESPVGVVTRAAIGAKGTRTYDQRYPAAGTPNADVSLFVMDPDGTGRVQVDLGPDKDIYLARVDWAPDGSALYVQRLDRKQFTLDMLRVDPATGESSVLFTEKAADGHWINLTNNYKFLRDGSLIWWSERSGFGHLYRFADGDWQQLTSGDWVVTGLTGVDQDAGRIYFTGTKDDPLATQVYALDLADPSAIDRLSDPAFANSASMDKSGQLLVMRRSSDTQPSQIYLADHSGERLTWIEQNELDGSHPYAPFLPSHRPATYGSIPGADGQPLYWRMTTPELEPGKRYPVFFQHYGGPHAQTVTKGWGGALEQYIVDRGYIFFEIDNRGSNNRGVDFEKAIYRAMGTVEVEDQKRGAEYLKTLDFVDPDRIATYGWSYGGYMTLKMLEADPGLYAAGISGAPVTRWELYDTAYTERYMGTPQDDADAYARSEAIEDAAKISDPLLLVHGMADDNVVFENSTELAAKLQGEAVPFEMMFYPGYTHSVGGPKISVHLWNTIFDFLDRHGVGPAD
ncbi:dipeptidyl-peptidase-4 [Altererythrobacter atlanticus]|uniref:Prolyl tripeptidyl peptidase n=1 Tax=Croceibacterium atlanticum TaxID=1267766 RepID=A0A0F7KL52_9SPHN|nr:S9 family peptidase [Croceibacterium atlanticum]AKH41288.1 Prolyl tripeptidyl peptidase precursor [Croceibacterium atlanticum]MBB5732806.1 dipeptidyl-peptidase-4 [Croceibacterium atlanticum]